MMQENKEKLNFGIVTKTIEEIPNFTEKIYNGKDYIYFGDDNLFPQTLWKLFLDSAIFQSIIKCENDYCAGDAVIVNELLQKYEVKVNKEYESLKDIVIKSIFDLNLFGGFAVQVFKDENGNITELYHIDLQNIRISKDKKHCYYSEGWGKWGEKAIKIPLFDREKNYRNSIYVYKGKISRQTAVYPVPDYIGALTDIITSTSISNFHLNAIKNNFFASAIINFNNGQPDTDTQKKIEKQIESKFNGDENAGKFLLSFNDNKDSAVTIERLQSDDFDKRFEQLQKTTIKNIFVAFRATPNLCGLITENNGFNSQEYFEAFELYNKTTIKPKQDEITKAFSVIFGVDNAIKFAPFKLNNQNENIE